MQSSSRENAAQKADRKNWRWSWRRFCFLQDQPEKLVEILLVWKGIPLVLECTKNEEYVDESQHARENPEKYEREQVKKSAPVRGEKTPMPPRGDKRREDFEKWYAKNVR
jgi:hypothetical protein